nr:UTRA domain-containing protein [Xanthobacter aminoxidans]
MFQFFKLVGDDGERHFPESRVLGIERAKGTAAECAALALARNGRVLRIRRLRTFDGAPLIIESLILPDQMFPGLADAPVPNNLYGLYAQRYGITVARAREQLKAVGADADTAAMLNVEPGAPVLLIDRLAYSLDGTPVEWRISFCLTAGFHYLSDLT